MDEDLFYEFEAELGKLHNLKEPETAEEVGLLLADVSKTMQHCEKMLLYLATGHEHREDMLTCLFEYKQLLNVEKHLHELKYKMPHQASHESRD